MILMGTWPAWSEWKSDVFLLQQDQQNPKGIWRVPIETRPEWPQPKSDLTLFRQDQRRPDGNLTPVNMQHDRATRSFLKSDVFLLQQDQQKSIGVWSVLVVVKPADIPWECDMFISQNQSGPDHRSQITVVQWDRNNPSGNPMFVFYHRSSNDPAEIWRVFLATRPARVQ